MKASYVLVVSLAMGVVPARAQVVSHVRPLDDISAAALERGVQASPRFRALLDDLDASDVIAHVVASPALPFGMTGAMRFVAQRGGIRYIRIELSTLAAPDTRVATLAHELYHARELALSPAGSQDEVRGLYRAIGHAVPGPHEAYETYAAQRAGAAVWSELRSVRREGRATDD